MKFAVRMSELKSQVPTLLEAKMVQQSKQERVGARQGFPCKSVKLVILVNGSRYEVDANTFFRSGKALCLI
jgi:hypothetical protein